MSLSASVTNSSQAHTCTSPQEHTRTCLYGIEWDIDDEIVDTGLGRADLEPQRDRECELHSVNAKKNSFCISSLAVCKHDNDELCLLHEMNYACFMIWTTLAPGCELYAPHNELCLLHDMDYACSRMWTICSRLWTTLAPHYELRLLQDVNYMLQIMNYACSTLWATLYACSRMWTICSRLWVMLAPHY